jgi:lipopolysaccharide transport system permease protein
VENEVDVKGDLKGRPEASTDARSSILSPRSSNNSSSTSQEPISTDSDASLIIIERRSGWQWINWRELWRYRELLYFLVWRDIKVRYKQTVLGAAWAILQPLAMMLVFSLFFGRYAGLPSARIPYPLFVFAGLLSWFFFANGLGSASHSVIGSQNLITKVYFPRLLIPAGAVVVCLVDWIIGFVVLLLMTGAYMIAGQSVSPGWTLLWVPLLMACLVMASLGVGTWLSALTVAYRDFRHVIPFLIQLWMFATPCIYMQTDRVLHPRWGWVLPLNPAYGLIENFRNAVLGRDLDLYSLAVSGLVAVLLLLMGCRYFQAVERGFADVI